MVAQTDPARTGGGRLRFSQWTARLVARPGFQAWAARTPVFRLFARRDGTDIFEVLQGFVSSQVLLALVRMGVLQQLLEQPETAQSLAHRHSVLPDRMAALMQAGAALGLLRKHKDGRFTLARKGAAILGVPGLEDMIRHNQAFYQDMFEPEKLLRGESETELAQFWPYVFGGQQGMSRDAADRYSDLMARSQVLVAQDTLATGALKGVNTLLDVGGGAGVFLAHALRHGQNMRGMLLDLPDVLPSAVTYLNEQDLMDRVELCPGSFRHDTLPRGADAVSLIRVLYDHSDTTVVDLLRSVYEALPRGGRLIISEPMSGGAAPDRAGDIYFAFYTMAMGTGRARSAEQIGTLCNEAGFDEIRSPKSRRPFVTSVVTCRKP